MKYVFHVFNPSMQHFLHLLHTCNYGTPPTNVTFILARPLLRLGSQTLMYYTLSIRFASYSQLIIEDRLSAAEPELVNI